MKTSIVLFCLFVPCLCRAQSVVAYWNHAGLAVGGWPTTLRAVEYAAAVDGSTSPNTDPKVIEARTTVLLEGDWKAVIGPKLSRLSAVQQAEVLGSYRADDVVAILAGLPKPSYRLWARVQDAEGRWSRWTASVQAVSMAPGQVTNLQVR